MFQNARMVIVLNWRWVWKSIEYAIRSRSKSVFKRKHCPCWYFSLTLQLTCGSHFIVFVSFSLGVDFTLAHHYIWNTATSSFLPYYSSNHDSIFSIIFWADFPAFCSTFASFSSSSCWCTRVDFAKGNTSFRIRIWTTWGYLKINMQLIHVLQIFLLQFLIYLSWYETIKNVITCASNFRVCIIVIIESLYTCVVSAFTICYITIQKFAIVGRIASTVTCTTFSITSSPICVHVLTD